MTRMLRILAIGVALALSARTGLAQTLDVPIGGYMPLVGFGLTDEFKNENQELFFAADLSPIPGGNWLGQGNNRFDLALYDTGAAVHLLTADSRDRFDLIGQGFDGQTTISLGGATGLLEGIIEDPLGIYISGLAGRTNDETLNFTTPSLQGQTSVAIVSAPPESTLPNVIGIPISSQYTSVISTSNPQMFRRDGETVRTPQVELLPLGSGGLGITRRAPLTLRPASSFLVDPQYLFNFTNILDELPLTENPQTPTAAGLQGGGMFLTIDVANEGNVKEDSFFLFDTGATVSAVSELMAAELGFDPILDVPDFEVQVEGSGGTIDSVPGFVAEELRIATVGGEFVLNDVPLVVLDITDPGDPGNILPGLIGTNLFVGRDIVIDPNPAIGGGGVGPSLYISDPITSSRNWASRVADADFLNSINWNSPGVPAIDWSADVANLSGRDQVATLSADAQLHEMKVRGREAADMELRIENGATLSIFGGVELETNGGVFLDNGILDAQFVSIEDDGFLLGDGTVRAEFDNRRGLVSPGEVVGEMTIEGIFSNRFGGTLGIDLGGTVPGEQYDVLSIDGPVFLDGILQVNLVDLGEGIFQPSIGDEFEILSTTGNVNGKFAELALPNSATWDVLYDADSVTLRVLDVLEFLQGDYNGNGFVEQGDLDLVLLHWGEDGANAPANWTHDLPTGAIDQGELDAVLLNWGAGSLAASHAVPEPAALLLLLIAAAPWAAIRIHRVRDRAK